MKKVFKFFMAVAIVAVGFTACSSEEVTPNKGNGGDETGTTGEATYASFKFDFPKSTGTKALADYTPASPNENDAKDDDFAQDEPWLLIFNAQTKATEHCAQITGTDETVLVTVGDKKIFVVANVSGLSDTGGGVDDNFTSRMAGFISKTSTLDDFYALAFSAGTPQGKGASTAVMTDAEKAAARTFSIAPLYTHGNTATAGTATSQGLPASSTNGPTFTLTAGVTQAQAEDTGVTPSVSGSNSNNRFEIQLYYMLAKARLVTGPNALSDGTGSNQNVISDVKYSIKNLVKNTYYVQHISGGVKMSYYHTIFPYGDGSTTPPQSTFDPHLDYASNVNILAPASTSPGNYLYVPENTGANLLKGQASYYAINATYEPAEVVRTVTHNMNTGLVTTTDKLAAIGALDGEGAKDYIYTRIEIEGIAQGSCFKTLKLLKQAAWIKKYGTASNLWVGSGTVQQQTEADAIITDAIAANGNNADNVYYSFLNAQSWYRLYIGEGSGSSTIYGVLRGNKYTATINNITGPGMPGEGHLTEGPWEPVSAVTYINATIKAAEWTAVNQDDDL